MAAAALAVGLGTLLPRQGDRLAGARAEAGPEPVRHILVLANPIHTDIALPLDAATRARFSFLRDAGLLLDHPQARWLVIGWGGRSFYIETPTWAELKPLPLLRALAGDRSVLHLALAGVIDMDDPTLRGIDLGDAAYERLLDAVTATFARGADGRYQPIADAGYGPFDRFYEAEGRFQALLGCNTWTAAVLRRAGVTTGWWTPLPQLLFLSLDLHAGGATG
nr:TIGR02117 family protein [Aurantimonas sp. CSK15Z-1]